MNLSSSQVERIQDVTSISAVEAAADDVELVAVAIVVLVLADVPDREIVIDTAGIIKA